MFSKKRSTLMTVGPLHSSWSPFLGVVPSKEQSARVTDTYLD